MKIFCAIILMLCHHAVVIQAQLYGVKKIETNKTAGNDFMNGMFGMETFSNVKKMGNMGEAEYRKLMKDYTRAYFQVSPIF